MTELPADHLHEEAVETPAVVRRVQRKMAPIVPAHNIAGRALVLVIAIMTFLSCLTFGAVTLVRDTASVWENQISREATIQIKPVEGLDMEAALAQASEIASEFPGVKGTRIVDGDD
ncbi:ABC transporter permease, partial [Mesorhizobium sp. M1A.F.Ca.IN.020.06.1.1]